VSTTSATLQRRSHHHQPAALRGEQVADGGERGGLARAGRALHHHQCSVATEGGDRRGLTGIQPPSPVADQYQRLRDAGVRLGAAGSEPGGQVGFDL
jgi:hypothetical protein